MDPKEGKRENSDTFRGFINAGVSGPWRNTTRNGEYKGHKHPTRRLIEPRLRGISLPSPCTFFPHWAPCTPEAGHHGTLRRRYRSMESRSYDNHLRSLRWRCESKSFLEINKCAAAAACRAGDARPGLSLQRHPGPSKLRSEILARSNSSRRLSSERRLTPREARKRCVHASNDFRLSRRRLFSLQPPLDRSYIHDYAACPVHLSLHPPTPLLGTLA